MGRFFRLQSQLGIFLRNFVPHILSGFLQIFERSINSGLLEGADGFVRNILCILQNFPGLFIGLPQNLCLGLLQFVLLFRKLPALPGEILFIRGDFQTLFFDGDTILFQVGQ